MSGRPFPPPAYGRIAYVDLAAPTPFVAAYRPDGTLAVSVPWSVERDAYGEALAALGLHRPHQACKALAYLREGWDAYDPWGSGMMALGAVCDVLAAAGREDVIPESAGYRRAMFDARSVADIASDGEDFLASSLASLFLAGRVTVDDLALAARVLCRYLDAADAAGRSY